MPYSQRSSFLVKRRLLLTSPSKPILLLNRLFIGFVVFNESMKCPAVPSFSPCSSVLILTFLSISLRMAVFVMPDMANCLRSRGLMADDRVLRKVEYRHTHFCIYELV